MMDSIKQRITRRVSMNHVHQRRVVYKNNLPPLQFRDIYIEGANAQQQAYIKKEFHGEDSEVFTYEDLKRGYFRLLSDDMISEIIPHAVYDPMSNLYELHLKVKVEDNFSIRIGGSVSTTSSNQIYMGIGYQNLNYYAKGIYVDPNIRYDCHNLVKILCPKYAVDFDEFVDLACNLKLEPNDLKLSILPNSQRVFAETAVNRLYQETKAKR